MNEKTLLDVLDEVLDEVWGNFVGKVSGFFKQTRRRVKARKAVGLSANPSKFNAKLSEMARQDEERDELMLRKENYCRYILLGLLDMVEAIMLRYDVLAPDKLTDEVLTKIENLFYGGKRKVMMYSKWLYIADENSFTKEWPELFEPLRLGTYETVEDWFEFLENLPV